MKPASSHRHSRLRAAASRYREATKSLHAPVSAQSRYGLGWMNFFIADVQTGFGTFVAFLSGATRPDAGTGWTGAGGRHCCGNDQPDSWRRACRCRAREAGLAALGISLSLPPRCCGGSCPKQKPQKYENQEGSGSIAANRRAKV
jgi:hypothetical protein